MANKITVKTSKNNYIHAYKNIQHREYSLYNVFNKQSVSNQSSPSKNLFYSVFKASTVNKDTNCQLQPSTYKSTQV